MDSRTRRRRWFGGICLTGAVAMLAFGEFGPINHLSATGFLCYWLGCFVLTMGAIFAAMADLRALRMRGRAEQRDLMLKTLQDIEREKRERGLDEDKP